MRERLRERERGEDSLHASSTSCALSQHPKHPKKTTTKNATYPWPKHLLHHLDQCVGDGHSGETLLAAVRAGSGMPTQAGQEGHVQIELVHQPVHLRSQESMSGLYNRCIIDLSICLSSYLPSFFHFFLSICKYICRYVYIYIYIYIYQVQTTCN